MTQPHCPVCGAIALPTSINGLQCESCGLATTLSSNGIYSNHFDKESVSYPEDGSENTLEIEDKSFWFSHRHRIIENSLKNFKADGIILDIGGGNGYEAMRLQKIHSQTVLVEPSLPGCIASSNRGVKRVIQGTLESLKIKVNKISGACFFDVLEHLENPELLLAETNRILKPGGKIFITVPAYSFLWSDEDEYAQHKRRYSRKTLAEEVTRAGFKVEYTSYYFSVLVVPIFLFRTLPSLLGFRNLNKMDKNEHSSDSLMQKAIGWFLDKELDLIESGRSLPFGSSLICVAKKVGEANS